MNEIEVSTIEQEFHLTDTGNAEYLKSINKGKLLFLKDTKKFIRLTDNGWEDEEPFNITKELIPHLHLKAAECKDDTKRASISERAFHVESMPIQRNILALLEDYIPIELKNFDTNPMELNCINGVLNLKTKVFSIRNEDSLYLNQVNANYNIEATCPIWDKTLLEIFEGDKERINYLQTSLGYSILGLTREECFFLCYGPMGRNGKGVILETILHILGNYGQMSSFDSFLQKDTSSTARGLEAKGQLKGKRFVLSSEVNAGTRFDAALVKHLTGGDTLEGSKLFGTKYNFTPTHTHWMACNHLPSIKATDDAMWSRVKVLPFNRRFIEHQDMNTKLKEELKNEYDGILNRLIQGCYKYLEDGLKEPEVCIQAKDKYREDNDKVRKFIREYLIKDKTSDVPNTTAYECYKQWQQSPDGTDELISLRMFPTEMASRDVTVGKDSQKTVIFLGRRLKTGATGANNHPSPRGLLEQGHNFAPVASVVTPPEVNPATLAWLSA